MTVARALRYRVSSAFVEMLAAVDEARARSIGLAHTASRVVAGAQLGRSSFSTALAILLLCTWGTASSGPLFAPSPLCRARLSDDTAEIIAIRSKAEQGDVAAQYLLGLMYYNGDGATLNYTESAKWIQRAAEGGHADAQFLLADMYSNGDGLPKSDELALKWYRSAAEQGVADFQCFLGLTYISGIGATKDAAEAAHWFQLAANQGNAVAQSHLGRLYKGGFGVKQDESEAAKWYRKAAEQGEPDAQVRLGVMYFEGSTLTKDYAEAAKWYRAAAEQGKVEAQCLLGMLCSLGRGVPRDHTEAAKWYRKGAEAGYPPAQYSLGRAYLRGEGVERSPSEAAKWALRAAEQGHHDAQALLSGLYLKGSGVPQDDVYCYMWASLAAAGGNEKAAGLRDSVAALLTPNQLADAQKMSRKFSPTASWAAQEGTVSTKRPTTRPKSSGSGFYITTTGYFVTCAHVVAGASRLSIRTATGELPANVVRTDIANDIVILKVTGTFHALPVQSSAGVRLGDTVVTVGFPNPVLQGASAKFGRGEIAGLAGPQDDPRFFQISLPVQPGNSGGPLVDLRGNVVGVISSKLDQWNALRVSGALPEGVNYATKGSLLMNVLESIPELVAKLPPAELRTDRTVLPGTIEEACAMVLAY